MNLAFGAMGGSAGTADPEASTRGPARPRTSEPPEGRELPDGFDPSQLPDGGQPPAGGGGGPGGGFGRENILVERFHEDAEFEALYQDTPGRLPRRPVRQRHRRAILDDLVETLQEGTDVVKLRPSIDAATIAEDGRRIAASSPPNEHDHRAPRSSSSTTRRTSASSSAPRSQLAGFETDDRRDGPGGARGRRALPARCRRARRHAPDLDGFTVLQRLRDRGSTTQVIFLTARDATEDRVRGLTTGGADYQVKPFAVAELVARVRLRLAAGRSRVDDPHAALRRPRARPRAHRVTRAGEVVHLSPTEYKLLHYLLVNTGRVAAAGPDPRPRLVLRLRRRLLGRRHLHQLPAPQGRPERAEADPHDPRRRLHPARRAVSLRTRLLLASGLLLGLVVIGGSSCSATSARS